MSPTPEWITALSTVFLLLATSVYVYFSYSLTQETKKLRELETSPFVTVRIEPYNQTHMLKLEIENIGKSPAYNLNIAFGDETNKAFNSGKYKLPKTTITYLPTEQKITTLIGRIQDLESTLNEFEIDLKYQSKDGRLFKETVIINYKFMSEISMLLPTPQEISSLKDIKNEISKLTQTIKGIGQ